MSGDHLNLDDIESEFLQQCGPCDGGLPMGCSCSPRDFRGTMSALVAEVRRLRECEERVLAWVETWERESVERGPNDKIHSAGAAALLRLAIRRPA